MPRLGAMSARRSRGDRRGCKNFRVRTVWHCENWAKSDSARLPRKTAKRLPLVRRCASLGGYRRRACMPKSIWARNSRVASPTWFQCRVEMQQEVASRVVWRHAHGGRGRVFPRISAHSHVRLRQMAVAPEARQRRPRHLSQTRSAGGTDSTGQVGFASTSCTQHVRQSRRIPARCR
jgi:hypothetical protein